MIGICIATIMIGAGCGSKESGAAVETQPGIERKFERGPVQVILTVDKKEPTIADRIRLRMEVTADEDYDVRMPRFGEKLEQFGIVDYDTTQPELIEGGRTRQTRSYVLEPFLSGDYTIPVMTFLFSKRGEAEEKEHELETEVITLHVKSLLPEAAAEIKIHEIASPEELPREPVSRAWLALVGVVLILFAAGTVFWVRRKKLEESIESSIPAHDLAFGQIEALVAENLPEKGEIKEFYRRISDILRRYVENRFGLQAPEQTTEEFLGTLAVTRLLTPPQKELLKEFLRHCDLVKFAEHRPENDDIQKTFDSCKNFILETRDLSGGEETALNGTGAQPKNPEQAAAA